MKKHIKLYLLSLVLPFLVASCMDRNNFDIAIPKVPAVNNLQSTLTGDSVKLTWSLPAGFDTLIVSVKTNDGDVYLKNNATSYTYGIVQTNQDYSFTVKLRDTKGDISLGQTVRLNRAGAAPVTNVAAVQDNTDVNLTWTVPAGITGTTLKFGATTVNLGPTVTSYKITNAAIGKYTFSFVTNNSDNKPSNTVYFDFKVGSTIVAYLGVYADKATLLSSGDDDEIAAANWLFTNYPSAVYISFDQIRNGSIDLSQYRVIWWNRDVETGSALPSISTDATVLAKLTKFHKDGGNFLFSTYAIQYLWSMGRMTTAYKMGIDNGAGGNNPDVWGIGVKIGAHDQRSHPLFKDIAITTPNGGFSVIGAGWKENHNCVLVEMPAYYKLGNGDEMAYVKFTTDNNLKWLGVWDGIGDYFMCGVFELTPKDDFQGTSINIGIGGIEWHVNDVTNPYQSNIEKMYKNAVDYLKTK